jgi:hypothetical protein
MALVVKDDDIEIEKLELGPFGTNAYVLVCRATGDSVLLEELGHEGWTSAARARRRWTIRTSRGRWRWRWG